MICEWSDDELQRYFAEEQFAEMNSPYGDGVSSSKSRSPRDNPCASYLNRRQKLTRISIADGFVSILLTCRMEHRDYATVSYDQSAVSCTLSMSDNLRVSISRRGHYEVSVGDEVNLKVIKVARRDAWSINVDVISPITGYVIQFSLALVDALFDIHRAHSTTTKCN